MSTASFSLTNDAASDPESPIRVVVTPSQSAYFAGETLSVTITFTNTRTYSPEGEAGLSRVGNMPRSARTHKRASHSVSSAPIARPPTSSAGLYRPRTPTTAAGPGSPALTRQTSMENATRIKRRGLIGKEVGSEGKDKSVPDSVEQRRRKMSKSLSLNLGACQDASEIEGGLSETAKSASYMHRSFTADAHLLPSSPKISSPLARSETLPLSSKHPHARKQSLLDGTHYPFSPPPIFNTSDISTSPASLTSVTSNSSTANTLPSAPASTGPSTPSASTSSFSLALDPISEVSPVIPAHPYLSPSAPATASGSGLGPALSSPSIAVEAPSPPSASTDQHSYPPSSKSTSTRQVNRPPNLGIGKPSSRMFLNLSENNTELILYSYAQLKGTVTLTPIPSNTLPVSSSSKSSNRGFPQSPLLPSSSTSHLSPVPPPPLSTAQIEQQKAQTLAALRQALLKGSATAVGGGSMDITSRTHSRTPSASGAASLGGGLGSGSWGSFGGSASAGLVSAYGPPSAKPSLGTITSGSTEGPISPTSVSARQSHSRASSFSSGLLSIFGSPFGLGGGSGPASAPPVTHPNNLAASTSVPNVASSGTYGRQQNRQQQTQRPTRNRTASAGVVPSASSGWPSVTSPSTHQAPASAGFAQSSSISSFSALSSSGPGSGSGPKVGLGLGWPLGMGLSTEEVDPELPLPTFEALSTMLAVDVSLEPGRSKSYEYSILLPSNLPPTFRGRTLRFAYELVVGICRAGTGNNFVPSGKGLGPGGSVSKVMKVPIRLYTNVVVGRPPTPYDLLWPISKRRSTLGLGHRRGGKLLPRTKESGDNNDPYAGKVVELEPLHSLENSSQGKLPTIDSASSLSGNQASSSGSRDELKEYASRLVVELPASESDPQSSNRSSQTESNSRTASASTSSADRSLSPLLEEEMVKVNGHENGHMESPVHELAFKEKERIAKMRQREESDEPIPVGGCGEAFLFLMSLSFAVSYDVNKDGVKVAVLTFIKSAFRLGETIHGVVELNERQGRARVVQLSAHLESHESLPYPISTTPNTAAAVRQLKRVHVEHHSSFVLSTLRTTFALDIPSDASPAFQIKVGDDNLHTDSSSPKTKLEGGLEWKVRLCLLVAIAKESSDSGTEGVRFKSLVRDGPRGEWGSAWKAPASAAPSEKPILPSSSSSSELSTGQQQSQQGVVKSWTSFIAASFLGAAEGGYHDGDELPEDSLDQDDDDERGNEGNVNLYDGIKPDRAGGVGIGVNFGGGREARWQEVKLETVECEVPVRVWPGNTAFKPVDVVFDV
ncbi:Rgp1-domain-containing protein [Lentinula aciculospora]|uniref:Rgp1-domain-containing protein n=1 Tax=Lentinula aciculospora TaxID=153920 RepID=A0A9W9DUX5_9AGAR|nr:Rgp1-domain-containing protein [Lentinula aciculospora]